MFAPIKNYKNASELLAECVRLEKRYAAMEEDESCRKQLTQIYDKINSEFKGNVSAQKRRYEDAMKYNGDACESDESERSFAELKHFLKVTPDVEKYFDCASIIRQAEEKMDELNRMKEQYQKYRKNYPLRMIKSVKHVFINVVVWFYEHKIICSVFTVILACILGAFALDKKAQEAPIWVIENGTLETTGFWGAFYSYDGYEEPEGTYMTAFWGSICELFGKDAEYTLEMYYFPDKIWAETGETGVLELPQSVDGQAVVSVGHLGLGGEYGETSGISKIIIPEGVTTICACGGNFGGNEVLKEVVCPSTLKTIGTSSFKYSGLEVINLENVEYIESNAFEHTSIEVANLLSAKEIGEKAFAHSSLKEVYMPVVESMGDDAFRGCAKMKAIYLGANIKTLNYSMLPGGVSDYCDYDYAFVLDQNAQYSAEVLDIINDIIDPNHSGGEITLVYADFSELGLVKE